MLLMKNSQIVDLDKIMQDGNSIIGRGNYKDQGGLPIHGRYAATPKALQYPEDPSKPSYERRLFPRDSAVIGLALDAAGYTKKAIAVAQDWLNIFGRNADQIKQDLESKTSQMPYVRFDADTLQPATAEYQGNRPVSGKQNDALGLLAFLVGYLHNKYGTVINDKNENAAQAIAKLLSQGNYWEAEDNGPWEEIADRRKHAVSIGSGLAGLAWLNKSGIYVPAEAIEKGHESYENNISLENDPESTGRNYANLEKGFIPLLVLPDNGSQKMLVDKKQLEGILESWKDIKGEYGIARYPGDAYRGEHLDKEIVAGKGTEAQWTMGFPMEAIIYTLLNNTNEAENSIKKTLENSMVDGELPESWTPDIENGQIIRWRPNPHIPLLMSHAFLILAAYNLKATNRR